jgi:hypothetical protein
MEGREVGERRERAGVVKKGGREDILTADSGRVHGCRHTIPYKEPILSTAIKHVLC